MGEGEWWDNWQNNTRQGQSVLSMDRLLSYFLQGWQTSAWEISLLKLLWPLMWGCQVLGAPSYNSAAKHFRWDFNKWRTELYVKPLIEVMTLCLTHPLDAFISHACIFGQGPMDLLLYESPWLGWDGDRWVLYRHVLSRLYIHQGCSADLLDYNGLLTSSVKGYSQFFWSKCAFYMNVSFWPTLYTNVM